MTDYITTYTGVHFEPTDPKPEKVRIEDIAHALSMICRGNGHVKAFLSVGQHCIWCAREAEARGGSRRLILACLLHDACECYLSDVPSPFKKHLPEYNEAEDRMLDMVYEKYLGSALTPQEQRELKQIDRDLLYYDLKELLNEITPGPAPKLHIPISYRARPFEEVEQEYLELFRRYAIRPEDRRKISFADCRAYENCV